MVFLEREQAAVLEQAQILAAALLENLHPLGVRVPEPDQGLVVSQKQSQIPAAALGESNRLLRVRVPELDQSEVFQRLVAGVGNWPSRR
jgi:hypothetical protein